MYIYSHNEKSQGAKQLAIGLGIKKIRYGSKFKGSPEETVINWGNSQLSEEAHKCNVINSPGIIGVVTNKLFFLRLCKENKIRVPDFSDYIDCAYDWIDNDYIVVCRTLLRSSGGKGIVLARTKDQLIEAPLYVKYIPKDDEYRIHYYRIKEANEERYFVPFFAQRKYRNPEVARPNWKIRNLKGGFLYEHKTIEPPYDVFLQSANAFKASCLDFGAVDVIWNSKQQKAYVLEINTAPGLEGQTLQEYIKIFKGMDV